MSQQDLFKRILVSLQEATLDDAYWPATAALIDETCDIEGHELVVSEGPADDTLITLARLYYRGQRHQELERVYPEDYFHRDERVPRLKRLPDSQVVHVNDLYTDRERKTSATYNEALPPARFQNGLNVRMDGLNGSRVTWIIGDPSGASSWSSDQIEMIGGLLPHLRHFVRVRQALVNAEALGASATGMLDNSRIGVIHLDRRGAILAANDRARKLLRRGDGLSDRGGFLGARLAADNARLGKLLAGALPPFGGAAVGGSMTVSRSITLARLILHVNPVTVQQMDISASRVAALVLVADPESRPDIDPALVAEALDLTPTEGQVAAWLAEGRTVRDIANATRRKQRTVRWFIEQIFEKQGITRQADLVRLVLSIAEISGRGGDATGDV